MRRTDAPADDKAADARGGFSEARADELREAGVSEHAGFPNPAMDRSLQTLDFNKLLIRHSAATYMMRIEGDDWQSLGIRDGDIVIVDRALGHKANDLTVWWQGENFVIGQAARVPEDTETWGLVTAVIHRYRRWNASPPTRHSTHITPSTDP